VRSVGAVKRSGFLQKRGLCLLFLFLFSKSTLSASEVNSIDYQKVFELGVKALIQSDYSEAKRIFEALYFKTKSARVKLEWARSAFLAKDYSLAQRLFTEVLELEDIPDTVRFNVSLFLSEISKLSDFTDYRVSFVRDTNPFGSADAQTIEIFGIPFNYTPPNQKQTLNGVNLFFYHSRTITDDGLTRFLFELDGTNYQGKQNSKLTTRASLETRFNRLSNTSYRIGYETTLLRESKVVEQPFVSINYREDRLVGFFDRIQGELKHAKNRYPDYPFANSDTNSMNFSVAKNIKPTIQISSGLYLDKNFAEANFQSFQTWAYSVGLKFFTPFISSNTQITLLRSEREFNGIDDLFLKKRVDNRELISLSIQPYSFKVLGLYPAFEVGKERTKSSISINSFDKVVFNVSLRKTH